MSSLTLTLTLLLAEVTSVASIVNLHANLGGQITLPCDLTPPPHLANIDYILKWRKAGFRKAILIKYDGFSAQIQFERYEDRLELVSEVSLRISQVEAEDEGWYECQITYVDSTMQNPSNETRIFLTVHAPPEILRTSGHRLQFPRGDDVKLFCLGRGSPEPQITWRKDGEVLKNSVRTTVDNTEVRIVNLQREDGGTYSCTFVNMVGERTQHITVVVQGGPYIMSEPSNQTVMDGQRVEIPCETEGFPNKITYTWFKDDLDIKNSDGYRVGRLKISSKGSLLITTAIKKDTGWYKCQPSNGLGTDEASAYINVIYKPVVLVRQTQVTWARGHLQQLDCPVDANPKVTRIDWDKDQTSITATGRFDILDNGTLLVSSVERSDAGAYRCTPYNKLGQGLSSPRIQVLVKDKPDPPTFTVRPDAMYQREVGQSVTMPCEATGTPPPSIVWKKESSSLDLESPRITKTDYGLKIVDLQKEDHGKYECLAVNRVNTVVTVTELRISNTTPHAPYNVTITPGLFDVKIQWEPGYNGGQAQLYVLWFRDVSDNNWVTMSIDGKVTTYSLHRLEPDTEYEFKILSRNSYGNGAFSRPVRARTLGYHKDLVTALPTDANGVTFFPEVSENIGPRPSRPYNLTARVQNRNIHLRWRIPVNTQVNIFYYRIEYQRGDGNWILYNPIVSGYTTSSAQMEDMAYGTYEVLVRAYGVLAYSAPSNRVRVTVDDDDLVLPDALIGGIIGGILFLLVAVLLALVAIFHSRKKDRKAKSKKFNDVSYGKPDEMNGRSGEHPAQRDRWQQNGRRDFVTSPSPDNGIFFLPQTRSMDTRASLLLAEQRHLGDGGGDGGGGEEGGRSVSSPHSGARGRGANTSGTDAGVINTVPLNASGGGGDPSRQDYYDYDGGLRETSRSRSRSQPASLRYRGVGVGDPEVDPRGRGGGPRSRSQPGSPPAYPPHVLDPSHPPFPKSYSFPYHHRRPEDDENAPLPPSSHHHLHQRSFPPPGHSSYPFHSPPPPPPHPSSDPRSSRPPHPHPSHPSSSLPSSQHQYPSGDRQPLSQPSFHSEDDDVFNTSVSHHPVAGGGHGHHHQHQHHPHPPLPRHSSMVPGQTTYLTDDPRSSQLNPPMFGVEDISSVLDPSSSDPQTSQLQPPPPPPSSSSSSFQNQQQRQQLSLSSNAHSSFSPSSLSSSHHPVTARNFPHNAPPSFNIPHESSYSQSQPRELDWRDGSQSGGPPPLPQKFRSPSDNESSISSGRPLGYTRDRLQDAIQKLRHGHAAQPLSRYPAYMNNVSAYSDPVTQSRTDLYDPDFSPRPISSSHPHIPRPEDSRLSRDQRYPFAQQRPYQYGEPSLDYSIDDERRPRAHSEGSRGLRSLPPDSLEMANYYNNGASVPDMSSAVRGRSREQQPMRRDSSWGPDRGHVDRPYLPPQSHQDFSSAPSDRPLDGSFASHRDSSRTDNIPHHSTHHPLSSSSSSSRYLPSGQPNALSSYHRPLDSTSSGIGSRNTSQSTSSFNHPSRRGSAGKGSTSFSSGVDPDLSLDTSGVGAGVGIGSNNSGGGSVGNAFGNHRRDTSTDENYEFDSINALESDIMADLRRYSRLSNNNRDSLAPSRSDQSSQLGASESSDPFTSAPRPSKPSQYRDSEKRFERLREEFKQYRQQQQQQQPHPYPVGHDDTSSHAGIPMSTANLPLGSTGEPLYPMDSDML